MFVTLIPRSYGYTAVNAPHTTSKAAAIKLLPPESVPHDHPSIQQLLRHHNNSLASFFFCPDLQHTLRNKSKLLLPVILFSALVSPGQKEICSKRKKVWKNI
jgi:hypothetical protein